MKLIAQAVTVFVFIVGATALSPVLPVSADMADACNQTDASLKSECEKGYGGSQCSTLSGDKLTACEKGRQQAQTDGVNNNGTGGGSQSGGSGECGGAKTEIINCEEDAGLGAIASLIKIAIMIVTILIGIVAVGGIAYAAILYASARDNQGQVQQAIGIIRNVVIGLVMYGLSVAIINWLIPGGVIG